MPGTVADAWIAPFAAALRASPEVRAAAAGVQVVIEHRLAGAAREVGEGWHVVVDDGDVDVRPGPASAPDVTFIWDSAATVAAVRRGELGAQAAFADGRLRMGGDLRALTGATRVMAAFDTAQGWGPPPQDTAQGTGRPPPPATDDERTR